MKFYSLTENTATLWVSIRRADYWLDEVMSIVQAGKILNEFQSAGRIIGWMKYLRKAITMETI